MTAMHGAPQMPQLFKNDIGLALCHSTCAGHFEYLKGFCDYLHHNVGVHNFSEWVKSNVVLFVVGSKVSKQI